MTDIKYIDNLPCIQKDYCSLVNLTRIGLYSDGTNKLAFFGISNNFNQPITNISFNFIQYDENKNILSRQVVEFNDILIKKKSSHSMEDPLILNPLTHHVEIEVKHVDFGTLSFEDGGFYQPQPIANKKKKKTKHSSTQPVEVYKKDLDKKIFYSILIIAIAAIVILAIFFGIFNYDGRYYDYPSTSNVDDITHIFTIITGGRF